MLIAVQMGVSKLRVQRLSVDYEAIMALNGDLKEGEEGIS